MVTPVKDSDSGFKPIEWVYDPLEAPPTPDRGSCICSLHLSDGSQDDSNSIRIDPIALGLPWPTSFCAARQCIHWRAAEEAARELLEAFMGPRFRRRRFSRGSRETPTLDDLPGKEKAIAAAAVNAAIYLNPRAAPRRVALITKVLLLALLQHDVVEFDPDYQDHVVVHTIIDNWPIIVADPDGPVPNDTDISTTLANDLVKEDAVLGRGVMNGLLQYFQVRPRQRFTDIRDFLNHRAMKLAAELTLACIRFANDIQISPSEMAELSTFIRLVPDHLVLVSDLYSHEKEQNDLQFRSARITNTVYYLEHLLSVQPNCAKRICLQLIEQTETRMHQEMERLRNSTVLTNSQLRYIYAMVDCVAGNVLSSVTSKRYGGDCARRFAPREKEEARDTRTSPPKASPDFRKAITTIQQKSSLVWKVAYRRFST